MVQFWSRMDESVVYIHQNTFFKQVININFMLH